MGHPEIIIQPATSEFPNFFGLIRCTIDAPRGLYIPVLPSRINGLLFFGLCTTCMQNKSNKCTHDGEERYLTGEWTTIEVAAAIEAGYTCTR